jgi:leucyl-tRNA synthetase
MPYLAASVIGANRSLFITRMACLTCLTKTNFRSNYPKWTSSCLPNKANRLWVVLRIGCRTKVSPLELCTMPGFAGSSAYYLRYMDPQMTEALVDKKANEYWRNVDLYIGGTEHATGHLIYSRFWNKFLIRPYVPAKTNLSKS